MTIEELKEFYGNKKVLITGHTGFKGSWLTRILTLSGAEVTGYSLTPPTDPSLFEIAGLEDTIKSVVGDIRDLEHLSRVFEETRPEIVFQREQAGNSAASGSPADCAGILSGAGLHL